MGPCLKFTGGPPLDLLPPTSSALRQTQLDAEGYSIHSRTISHHSQLCKCTGCPHSLGVTPTTMNPRAEPCWKTNPAKADSPQGVAFPPVTPHRMRRLCHAIERAHCHFLPQIPATGARTACRTNKTQDPGGNFRRRKAHYYCHRTREGHTALSPGTRCRDLGHQTQIWRETFAATKHKPYRISCHVLCA